jgi:N-6 DNA Methylase
MNPSFFPTTMKNERHSMALSGTNSLGAWDKTINAIDKFNFKEIPTDILGHIF